ncbi:MAG: SMP-30/gluconolactonase/LRE family protein [Sedimentisphaerales bacterium]|nr:SMP-30/gluconolactonase/LRE family protein [Sedimentisphaerales bacterium]
MKGDGVAAGLARSISLFLWMVVIALPLLCVAALAIFAGSATTSTMGITDCIGRSFALAAIVAAAAVLLGWTPGRLLGTSRRRGDLLLMLVLMPLVLPRYVLYYAWSLLLTPTSTLGQDISARPQTAKAIWTIVSSSVLLLWCWPLAALLIAQGWRSFDRRIRDCASLDASGFAMFRSITLPILGPSLVLAFGVCFVLTVSEFATFHLGAVRTIGAELAVLYELTGSEGQVVRAAWPVIVVAVIAALGLSRRSKAWGHVDTAVATIESESQRWRWGVLLGLVGVSLVAPVVLLISNVRDSQAFRQFLALHPDELGWSLVVSAVAAAGAYMIAAAALRPARGSRARGILGLLVRTTIFVAMFVPASVIAVSLLRLLAASHLPSVVRQGWYVVSAGQAARFAGITLVLLLLTRQEQQQRLLEMAELDGASWFQAWRYVRLPLMWPLIVGTFILIIMLGVTELAATMVLLPAGLPNFAQRLLNQMHYARDQQVIASCLVLICVFVLLSGVVVLLLRFLRLSGRAVLLIVCAAVIGLGGCDSRSGDQGEAKVIDAFGRSGAGAGEFVYPRAIDIASDHSLLVVDKTGRIQRLDSKGGFLGVMNMPIIDAGKPTGLTIHPNGKLYVADTHYHRVVVFSEEGELIQQFGGFGEGDGQFIYPTDVVFSSSGLIYVTEYGGNDRVSVFDEAGVFQYCFGEPGVGEGQLSRPSAMCIDERRERLYVADACNHRIAVYGLDGVLSGYIGSAGRGAGELRYPYDMAILQDGTLVVCEFGNNRIQLFDPDGHSIGVYGRAGRELGQLAFPWAVAVDNRNRAYIVDAGNNRIQVWQL